MQHYIATDAVAAQIAGSQRAHGVVLLHALVVDCNRSGVEHSLLAQARDVLDRTYTLGAHTIP